MAITWKTHSFANPGCLQCWDGSHSQGCRASCVEQVCEELPGLGKPEKLAQECPEHLPAWGATRGPSQGALHAVARLLVFWHPAQAAPRLAKSKTEGQKAALHCAGLN